MIEINDYVEFIGNKNLLYKVLDISKDRLYILIEEFTTFSTYWERIEYVERYVKSYHLKDTE